MSLLVFPFVQSQLNIFTLKPLKGAITQAPDTSFSFRLWFNGHFQEIREAHLNESFGFRNLFVRLNNQVAFNLFNKANAEQVIIGKEKVLFEESYIKSYFGTDFIGEVKIADQVNKLKFLQDTLSKLNKSLILLFAPGKGYYFPEFIPDKYKRQVEKTNIDYWIRYSKEMNLNVVDFNSYFIANKNSSEYPLYPRNGIHWSYYGACLAADSLVRYIERLRRIDMTNLNWNSVLMEESRSGDRDIADGMNLLVEFEPELLAYPNLVYEPDSGKTKPAAIVISDSFYWTFVSLGFQRVFSANHFWYYNRQIYSDDHQNQMYLEDVDLLNEIQSHDIILIMGSTPSLCNLGWDFIDNAYFLYKGIKRVENESSAFKKKLRRFRSEILKNKAWMENIIIKAQKKNISVDSMVTLDAIYLIKNEKD
jgi:hypothetical protein